MNQTTKNAEKIQEIIGAITEFKSVKLADIFKQYNDKGITIISDKMDDGFAYYNKDIKMVTINRDFMNKKSKDNELQYILLHEYFHFIEAKSSYLSKNTLSREYADLYASHVFRINGVEVPRKFSREK